MAAGQVIAIAVPDSPPARFRVKWRIDAKLRGLVRSDSVATIDTEGIVGGTFLLNGKPTKAVDPDAASHIFAIPELGVSVPLYGIPDSAKNPCSNAPCPLSTDHETISFSFRTQGKGLYRWQCFVPCAAGFIAGFGGPMQTVGYMDGFIKVV